MTEIRFVDALRAAVDAGSPDPLTAAGFAVPTGDDLVEAMALLADVSSPARADALRLAVDAGDAGGHDDVWSRVAGAWHDSAPVDEPSAVVSAGEAEGPLDFAVVGGGPADVADPVAALAEVDLDDLDTDDPHPGPERDHRLDEADSTIGDPSVTDEAVAEGFGTGATSTDPGVEAGLDDAVGDAFDSVAPGLERAGDWADDWADDWAGTGDGHDRLVGSGDDGDLGLDAGLDDGPAQGRGDHDADPGELDGF